MPLHSRMCGILKRKISVLIVDEPHDYKNPATGLHAGIQSLEYEFAFLLSGTRMFNDWKDLAGQMALLPGSPIRDTDHFFRLFGTPMGRDGDFVGAP